MADYAERNAAIVAAYDGANAAALAVRYNITKRQVRRIVAMAEKTADSLTHSAAQAYLAGLLGERAPTVSTLQAWSRPSYRAARELDSRAIVPPRTRKIGGRVIWPRRELDRYAEELLGITI